MEPPPKRQRFAQSGVQVEEDDDELFLEPEELNQRRDPAFQLQKGRALAVNKLKSRFEDIFAKYERDFTDVADEIDLRTGEVVVNNGHLESMEFARDLDDGRDDDDDENGHASEEEKRILQGKGDTESSADAALATVRKDPWQVAEISWPPSAIGNTPRLSSMILPDQQPFMSPFASTPPFGMSTPRSLDPTWQAPELPISSFGHYNSKGHGQKTWSTTRKVAGKLLGAPNSAEAEEEDVLLGVSGNMRKTKESPLIKERFPVISSPQDDPGLSDFIQEVIQENMPESSPSNRIEKIPGPKSRRSLPKREPSGLRTSGAGKNRAQGRSKGSKSRRSASQGRKSSLMNSTASPSLVPNEEQPTEKYRASMDSNEGEHFEVIESHMTRPLNQVLYVEIRRTEKKKDFVPVRGEADFAEVEDDKDLEVISSKPTVQGKMERNVVDSSFNFSDDDKLLPRKTRRRRRTEPITAAAAVTTNGDSSDAKSKSGGQPLERNAVDPAFAFSDEENMPPRRSRRRTRLSEPVPPLQTTITGSKATTDTSRRVGTGRSKSRTEPRESTHADSQETGPSLANSASATDQGNDQADNQVDAQENTSVEDHTQSGPGPQGEPASPSPPKQHQQEHPATPHRSGPEKPPLPTDTSLISLLSDHEDEEDEISFSLTDFTPSGHHRILVHRPFPGFVTNPSFSSSSKTNPTNSKNKRRRNSFFPSSQKQRRTQHTDDKTPSHKGSSSTSKKRRQSHHNHLACSVVKVRHRHERLPSPTGSIVQTPGGTKRRCGEGDFRCERDFCFVCM